MFVKGVWGPYFSAMVPGLWLNEGGQSATGKLVSENLYFYVMNYVNLSSIFAKVKFEQVGIM